VESPGWGLVPKTVPSLQLQSQAQAVLLLPRNWSPNALLGFTNLLLAGLTEILSLIDLM
jgi:hypothetical protein